MTIDALDPDHHQPSRVASGLPHRVRLGRRRQRLAAACVASVLALAPAAGQSPAPRHLSALIGGRIDTIEVVDSRGGELLWSGARMLLARDRAGFVGHLTRRVTRPAAALSDTSGARACDTSATVRISGAKAMRLIERIGDTPIVEGAVRAPIRATDIWIDDRIRLAAAGGSVLIRDGRQFIRRDSVFHADRPTTRFGDPLRPAALDEALMMFRRYANPKWVARFEAACLR